MRMLLSAHGWRGHVGQMGGTRDLIDLGAEDLIGTGSGATWSS